MAREYKKRGKYVCMYINYCVLSDITLEKHRWVSPHNSLAFTQILLYHCKEFLWWLLQLQTDFQHTTLNGCGITGWIFYSQIRSCNFDSSWVLCHISVVFFRILFKPQKKHSYDGYSTYMPSFIQFLPVVYPVGMTDLRPFLREKSIITP